ncbi:MAG: hypothetical protein COV67_01290 [Nitrospinae bacterium CG11_big_fil_rev_8_21_14_0_20_56_8]|nr:MAG: hypothetical protein COV67_01290 [Nitrospinae bacterium CG11_big_fil_rev_8_21_14_0_20_56_8]
MLTQKNLVLTRAEPNGMGGLQFLYRVGQYGIVAGSQPCEEIHQIHWEADVVKFISLKPLQFEVCHTTELADKTLKFRNDKAINEFLEKAFSYFGELALLEGMLPQAEQP